MSNVGFATLQIVPSAQGFKAALGKEIDAPLAAAGKRGGEQAGKEAGRGITGGLLPAVAKIAPVLGAAFAGVQIGGFLKDSITAASDASESINAVRVSYGEAADAVLKLGENSARSFGLSAVELNDFAVQFSGFAQGIAGSTGDSAKVFENITQRATDFASVMNLQVSDAAALFQSGLAGETEPLRRYGIDLSAAAVEAYALANGMEKGKKGFSEAQKQQARYGLLMEKTSKVQGDFANTSGGMANQQRILSASFENLKVKVGTAFFPIMAGVFKFINDKVFPVLVKFADGIQPAVTAFGDFITKLKGGKGPLAGVAATVGNLKPVLGQVAGFFAKFGDAVVATLPSLIAMAQTVSQKLVGAFKGYLPVMLNIGKVILGTVGPAFLAFGTFIATKVVPALAALGAFIAGEILPRIVGTATVVGENLLPAFRAIATAVATRVLPGLQKLGEALILAVDKIKPLLTFLVRLGGVVLGVVSKALGFLIPIILKVAGPVFSALIAVLSKVVGWIGSVLGWVGKFGNGLLDSGGKVSAFATTVRDKITSVVNMFRSLPDRVKSAIGNMGSILFQKGRDLVQGLINGAGSLLNKVGQFFLDKLPAWIRTPFKKALGIQSPSKVFAGYGKNVGEGFVKGVRSQNRAVENAVRELGANASASPTLAVSPPKMPDVSTGGRAAGAAAFAPTIVNNYPAPEPASDSLTVSLRRAAFVMGG